MPETGNGNVCGNRLIVEQFLPGAELTAAVLPPGSYRFPHGEDVRDAHWELPPVLRLGHQAGVAPYNGVVAVTRNSIVLDADAQQNPAVARQRRDCVAAASLLGVRSAIRIDARPDATGVFRLFDRNMKPNMNGPGRPGREDQDSLVGLAAHEIGWTTRNCCKICFYNGGRWGSNFVACDGCRARNRVLPSGAEPPPAVLVPGSRAVRYGEPGDLLRGHEDGLPRRRLAMDSPLARPAQQ